MAEFAFTDGGIPSAVTWNANVRDQLVVICTSSTRPGSPSNGRRIYETDTGLEYIYLSGAWQLYNSVALASTWTLYTPSWISSGTQPVLGNGTFFGYYRKVGKTVDVCFSLTFGSTSTFGTGAYSFSLPVGVTAAAYTVGAFNMYPGSNYFMGHFMASGTSAALTSVTSTASTAMTGVTGTVPATLATSNFILGSIQVFAA